MKAWALLIGIIIICALVGSPVLAISKSDLMASYRTTESPIPIFKDSTTDIPPIEVLSPTNPYHWGDAVYYDLGGRLILNGTYLTGKSDLYLKPKWTGMR